MLFNEILIWPLNLTTNSSGQSEQNLARGSADFPNPYLAANEQTESQTGDVSSEIVADYNKDDNYSYEYLYVYDGTTRNPIEPTGTTIESTTFVGTLDSSVDNVDISGFGTEPDYIESSTVSTPVTAMSSTTVGVRPTVKATSTKEIDQSTVLKPIDSLSNPVDYFYYNENPVKFTESDSDSSSKNIGRNFTDTFFDYEGFEGKSTSVTDFGGCTHAEGAYDMDQTIKKIECAEGVCNILCRRKGEIPTVGKIRCRNPRKNRWTPTPKKYGAVSCALPHGQTTCGPVRKNYQVDPEVKLNCKNDKCTVGCPEGKMSTMPSRKKQLICRNARKNVWNVRKTTRIQCLRPRSVENAQTVFCGHVEDHFDWYKVNRFTFFKLKTTLKNNVKKSKK